MVPSNDSNDEGVVRDMHTAPGTDAPEPHEAPNQTGGTGGDATGVASGDEVQEQREEEQEALLAQREEEGKVEVSRSEKGAQTRAAKPVKEQAAADAEARAGLTEGDEDEDGEKAENPLAPNFTRDSDDPVQQQRNEEAEAREAKAAEATADLSDEDKRLLGAAPGGQRTAMTDGKEGSTTVTHTAAQARPPLSGPLSPPVTDVENLAASEDDPDNRVYADEAGPRDVFEDTEGAKARYVDGDGNALDYDGIFEDEENKTYVTAKTRVYEVFRFPNTEVDGKRLAYAAGRRVPRGEAENVRNQISVHSQIA